MKIETFIKGDKKGVRFKDAVFAASKNHNGAHFDPLEVFAVDIAPQKFNKSHSEKDLVEAKFETKPTFEIEGKLLKFKADIVSYDQYVIDNADKISGLSPELKPVNEPARRGDERFYATGDLVWEATAFLFGETPGFVGADKFTLEKFSAKDSDVILYEKFEETDGENEKTEVATAENDGEQKTETFNYEELAKQVAEKISGSIKSQVEEQMKEMFSAQAEKNEEEEAKKIEQRIEMFVKNKEQMEKFSNEELVTKGDEVPVAKLKDEAKIITSIKEKFNLK